ncbi:MAG: dihydroorotate dehydrogenase-like protein [Actinomycetota bacterium]|nr:dihydroorotate dehydrogenase-like protein [Actinomycetota bacterium]
MIDLKTSYMGINLKNPLILGACNISEDTESAKILEDDGIAAIVFKSLFEEQIIFEKIQLKEFRNEYADRHAEMISVFPSISHGGPKEHLYKIKKLRNAVKIPIIASLNCINKETWIDYAKQLEDTGVDGLELNFYSSHAVNDQKNINIEKMQLDVIASIISSINIPASVKMNYFFTDIKSIIIDMAKTGIKGFVFFNKVFTPEINIEKEDYFYPMPISCKCENKIPLRFTGMLSAKTKADICSSTGIFDAEDVISMILSGASCVQMVSTIYKNKLKNTDVILSDIRKWMKEHNYGSIADFKGKLSKENLKDPFFLEREQYIDILNNNETIIKKQYKI